MGQTLRFLCSLLYFMGSTCCRPLQARVCACSFASTAQRQFAVWTHPVGSYSVMQSWSASPARGARWFCSRVFLLLRLRLLFLLLADTATCQELS